MGIEVGGLGGWVEGIVSWGGLCVYFFFLFDVIEGEYGLYVFR